MRYRSLIFVALCCLGGTVHAQRAPGSWNLLQQSEIGRTVKLGHASAPVQVAPVATPRLIVELWSAEDAGIVTQSYGLRRINSFVGAPTWVVLDAGTVAQAQILAASLRLDPRVRSASNDQLVSVRQDAFTPDDPYYFPNNPASGWPGQWYLNNTFVAGRDLHVVPAWNRDLTGSGVIIGFVDDGLQTGPKPPATGGPYGPPYGHPDLEDNMYASGHYDFGQNDNNPNPVSTADNHGTCVAGIAAARGGNTLGVCGVAPLAKMAMMRIDFASSQYASQIANATTYKSSGADHPVSIKNHSYGVTSSFANVQSFVDAMATSTAAGTIHIRSAGNGRNGFSEDANKYMERNTPDAITVAAMGSDGVFSSYSSFGSCVFCTAPSDSENQNTLKILTSDRTTEGLGYNGSFDTFPDTNYASTFGGTSMAAPAVAGVMALLRQQVPTATTRYAKHLLVKTCKVVDSLDATIASDGGWKTNGAGNKFNQNYGFGLVDADALTLATATYSGVTPLTTESVATTTVNGAIPDNNSTGISRTFNITSTTPLEEVIITLSITHPYRGDVEAYLTSPQGTTSRLLIQSGSDGSANITSWPCLSNAFWGENPSGTWTIKLIDTFSGDTGTWVSYAAQMRMGQLVNASKTVTGTVDLTEFVPGPDGQSVTFELTAPGSGTILDTETVALDGSGNYSFTTALSGTYDIYAKGSHWLRKVQSNVAISGSGASGVNFSLPNGDIDDDNAVTVFDYGILSDYFDKTSGDGDWNTVGANGASPAMADIDGDEAITVFDYGIISTNFDMSGD